MKFKASIIAGLTITIALTLVWFLSSSFVSKKARITARIALENKLGETPETGTLIIVDFSQPSQTRRLEVINMESGNVEFSGRVAHGKNSGGVYAQKFSNAIDSFQSSIGLFEVSEIFDGKHGPSIRLKGLEPSLNGNAEIRGIIVHSAKYVSLKSILANWKEKFRLGRSQGCFVVSEADIKKLISSITAPAYLYAYAYHDELKPR
jgi:hypothetical protein